MFLILWSMYNHYGGGMDLCGPLWIYTKNEASIQADLALKTIPLASIAFSTHVNGFTMDIIKIRKITYENHEKPMKIMRKSMHIEENHKKTYENHKKTYDNHQKPYEKA